MQPVGKTYEQLNTHHRKPQASRRTRCGKWRLNGVLKPIYFLIPPEMRAPRRDAYGCAPSASLAHVVAAQSPPEEGPW